MTDEEWDKARAAMIADCPLLFRCDTPAPAPYFHFQILRGWHTPVRKACLALERIAEGHEEPVGPDWIDLRPRAAQIKEKFGGLRFYIDGHSDEAAAVIGIAEAECWKTCEACGAPGRRRDEFEWITTLCGAHYAEERADADFND